MDLLLNDPRLQSSLLPLVVSLILTGLLGFGAKSGARLASTAVAAGLLVATLVIQGWVFPPRAASQKLPYLIVAATLAGLFVDLKGLTGWLRRTLYLLAPVAMLAWLFGGRVTTFDLLEWGYLVLLVVLSAVAYWRCEQNPRSIEGSLNLLLVSLGLGAVVLIGASAMLAQVTFALAAALGGFLLLNWPRPRFPFAAAGQFATVTALAAVGAQALFYTQSSGIALALLVSLLFADVLVRRVPLLNRATTPALRAVSLGLAGALFLPIVVGSAWLLSDGGLGY